jgi:hypothetical protein
MTALYVPGVEETDTKKLIRSQQLVASATSTNTTNVASNTASIATNTASIATNTAAIATNTAAIATNAANLAALTGSKITASLSGDVALNNTANYFDGPSVAQGTVGTWFASGTITVIDTAAGPDAFDVKLWDGTTVIASTRVAASQNFAATATLSGVIASPAANIRISVKDATNTTGAIKFNLTGNSKDSTVSAYRIA